MSQVAQLVRAYPPLDGMQVHHRVVPSIKLNGIHLYAWVEKGILRVNCLVQEHTTVSLVRT